MKAHRLTLVRGDDWEGIYLDGALKREGHSFSLNRAIYELGNVCVVLGEVVDVDEEWLIERGNLPARLADVKRRAA